MLPFRAEIQLLVTNRPGGRMRREGRPPVPSATRAEKTDFERLF